MLAHLSSWSNNGSAVLVPNAMMEALQVKVSYTQQGMLLQVIKWIRTKRLVLRSAIQMVMNVLAKLLTSDSPAMAHPPPFSRTFPSL